MLCAQVVANGGHRVAVHLKSATLDFFCDKSTYRIVYKTPLFDQIVHDGAFAGPQRACYAYCYHCLSVLLQ